jgi:hypothetical protein
MREILQLDFAYQRVHIEGEKAAWTTCITSAFDTSPSVLTRHDCNWIKIAHPCQLC